MALSLGTLTIDLLARLNGGETTEIGTITVPIETKSNKATGAVRTITADARNAAAQSLGIDTTDLVDMRWPLESIVLTYLVRDPVTSRPVYDGQKHLTRTEVIAVVPS